jgi:hypothetical protein
MPTAISRQVLGKRRAQVRRRERICRALEASIAVADDRQRLEHAAQSRMASAASSLPPAAVMTLKDEVDALGPDRGPRVLAKAIRLLAAGG